MNGSRGRGEFHHRHQLGGVAESGTWKNREKHGKMEKGKPDGKRWKKMEKMEKVGTRGTTTSSVTDATMPKAMPAFSAHRLEMDGWTDWSERRSFPSPEGASTCTSIVGPSGRTAEYCDTRAHRHTTTFPHSRSFWTLANHLHRTLNNLLHDCKSTVSPHLRQHPNSVKDQMMTKLTSRLAPSDGFACTAEVGEERMYCTVLRTCTAVLYSATTVGPELLKKNIRNTPTEYSASVPPCLRTSVPPYIRTCTTMSPPGRRSCRTGRKAARENRENPRRGKVVHRSVALSTRSVIEASVESTE